MATEKTLTLVTGGAQGLGLEVVKTLSRTGKHHVLLAARTFDRAQKAVNVLTSDTDDPIDAGTASPLAMDVCDDASIVAAAAHVKDKIGRLDILINNAGVTGLAPNQGATTRETMRFVFETNVFGPAVVTEHFLPLLRASSHRDRRVVNVSSGAGRIALAGDRSSSKHNARAMALTAYRTSKAGLNMLSVVQAMQLEDEDIACVVTSPGHCRTPINGWTGPRSAAEGAAIIVRAATEGNAREISGTYQAEEPGLIEGW